MNSLFIFKILFFGKGNGIWSVYIIWKFIFQLLVDSGAKLAGAFWGKIGWGKMDPLYQKKRWPPNGWLPIFLNSFWIFPLKSTPPYLFFAHFCLNYVRLVHLRYLFSTNGHKIASIVTIFLPSCIIAHVALFLAVFHNFNIV